VAAVAEPIAPVAQPAESPTSSPEASVPLVPIAEPVVDMPMPSAELVAVAPLVETPAEEEPLPVTSIAASVELASAESAAPAPMQEEVQAEPSPMEEKNPVEIMPLAQAKVLTATSAAEVESSTVVSAIDVQPVAVKTPEPIAPEAKELPVAGDQSLDDAYAPLWLDILPQAGTTLAAKNAEEATSSVATERVAVTVAQSVPLPTLSAPVAAVPGLLTLGLLDTGDQAKLDQFVSEVESKLGQPVKVQLLANEGALVHWFKSLGAVDLVVIPVGERGDLLAGDYALLQVMPRTEGSPRQILVARRDLSPAQLQRLEQLFGAAR